MSLEDYDRYSRLILYIAGAFYIVNILLYLALFCYNKMICCKSIPCFAINLNQTIETTQTTPTALRSKRVGPSKTLKSEGAKNIPIVITVPSLASSSASSVAEVSLDSDQKPQIQPQPQQQQLQQPQPQQNQPTSSPVAPPSASAPPSKVQKVESPPTTSPKHQAPKTIKTTKTAKTNKFGKPENKNHSPRDKQLNQKQSPKVQKLVKKSPTIV